MNWLSLLFRRRKQEQELDAELRFHLEQQIEDNIAAGISPEEARRTAMLSFGGLEQIKETCRDERSFVWIEQLGKDSRYVARSLIRAPIFTLIVLLTLIVGVSAAALVFRMTDKVALLGLPFPKPEQLFILGYQDKTTPFGPIVQFPAQYEAYTAQSELFSEFATAKNTNENIVVNGQPLLPFYSAISSDFFKTLGIQPALGRLFVPEDYQSGAGNVVIISDSYWRQYFHSSPDALGQTVYLGSKACTIVGILAPDLRLPSGFSGNIFHPLAPKGDHHLMIVLGRLQAGVTAQQAMAALSALELSGLSTSERNITRDRKLALKSLTELNRPELSWVGLAAGALLYLLACINVMNLMLVRLLNRRREFGIRLALGGTRWRIARLLLIESVILAGITFAVVFWLSRFILIQIITQVLRAPFNPGISFGTGTNLIFISSLCLLTGGLILIAPLLYLRKTALSAGLKDGGLPGTESKLWRKLRTTLVVLQAAFAFILLIGSGLMLRTFDKLSQIDLGFNPMGRVSVGLGYTANFATNAKPEVRLQFFEKLVEKLGALPGVKSIAYGQNAVLNGQAYGGGFSQLAMPDGSASPVTAAFVHENFPATAGLVMKQGRLFSSTHGANEAVINESMARARFGDADPIGQSFQLVRRGNAKAPPEAYLVVGVVKDVREIMTSPVGLRYYVPIWRSPISIYNIMLHVDATAWRKESADQIRRVIYETDPRLIVYNISTMEELIERGVWSQRYAYNLLRSISLIALGLVIVGLFSVVSYTVNSRMREFGVRLALGAQPSNLHRLVMKHGLVTTGIGLVIGIAGALALTRFMQSLLYETTPYDPSVYGGVALILLGATILACWLPARRAARADVAQLLRTE